MYITHEKITHAAVAITLCGPSFTTDFTSAGTRALTLMKLALESENCWSSCRRCHNE